MATGKLSLSDAMAMRQNALDRLQGFVAERDMVRAQLSKKEKEDALKALEKQEAEDANNWAGSGVKGAAIGTAILPGWGTLIGGVAGAGLGIAKDAKYRHEKKGKSWKTALGDSLKSGGRAAHLLDADNWKSLAAIGGATARGIRQNQAEEQRLSAADKLANRDFASTQSSTGFLPSDYAPEEKAFALPESIYDTPEQSGSFGSSSMGTGLVGPGENPYASGGTAFNNSMSEAARQYQNSFNDSMGGEYQPTSTDYYTNPEREVLMRLSDRTRKLAY